MKVIFFASLYFIASIFALDAFALGNDGPMQLGKDGLENKKPYVLKQLAVEEHLGESIDLTLPFVDQNGKDVTLGSYVSKKPVFLMMIYYDCPTLCNLHLNSLMDTFREFEWNIGEEFDLVAVSIDPKETPEIANKKMQTYIQSYGRKNDKDGWHFLTGKKENIDKLANQVGFKFAWDYHQRQWAHPAVAYIITPQGKISYYHYGISIQQKVLRLSLVEAAENKIGTIMDRMVLFCLQYDPNKKTYAFYAFNIMRVGGIITIIILFIVFFRFWKKEQRNSQI